MKKLKKINLHHLCKTKMTNFEQNVLRGGGYCITICTGSMCGCFEDTQDTVDVSLRNINGEQTLKIQDEINTRSNN